MTAYPFDVTWWGALGICLIISVIFVLSLYVWNVIDGNEVIRHRNDKYVVYRRFASVAITCILTPIVCYFAIPLNESYPHSFWTALGVWPIEVMSILYSIALVLVLYCGPLTMMAVDRMNQPPPPSRKLVHHPDDNTQEHTYRLLIRDILVAPLAEEFAFRACSVPFLISGGISVNATIFICPLFFGLAHMHHVREHIKVNGYSRQEAIQLALGQLLVTSLFGAFATFIFLRMSSFLACFTAHALCNALGVPKFQAALTHTTHKTLICIAFVVGMLGFIIALIFITLYDMPGLSSYYWEEFYW